MNFRKSLLIILFTLPALPALSQFHHNFELGGSNFTGFGLNVDYHFHLNPESPVYIAPKLGIGYIMLWDELLTTQAGLGIGYKFNEKHWLELNSSVSYLIQTPFVRYETHQGQAFPTNRSEEAGNFLWYTGLDYKVKLGKLRYAFGGGVITIINQDGPGSYQVEDFIPMLKLGIGF